MDSLRSNVGGAELTDVSGSTRLPITPVTLQQEREALTIITEGLFRSNSFKVSPEFMRKLASDRLEREELYLSNPQAMPAMVELALSDRVLAVQRDVLNRLMSPVVARRIAESNAQAKKGGETFRLSGCTAPQLPSGKRHGPGRNRSAAQESQRALAASDRCSSRRLELSCRCAR